MIVHQAAPRFDIREQADDVTRRARRVLDLRQDYRARVSLVGSSVLLDRTVYLLFERPATTVPELARRLEVTQRSAGLLLGKLERAGIVAQVGDRVRNRVCLASGVLAVIEGREPEVGRADGLGQGGTDRPPAR